VTVLREEIKPDY